MVFSGEVTKEDSPLSSTNREPVLYRNHWPLMFAQRRRDRQVQNKQKVDRRSQTHLSPGEFRFTELLLETYEEILRAG